MILTEFEEEEGKEIILLSGNLVHEVAAEASQTLERLAELVWDKKEPEAARSGDTRQWHRRH